MTTLRTWSTVQVTGLLLTASPHLQDLTNEMPLGDWDSAIQCVLVIRDSRHMRAIRWPLGRWRARRRIDTGHARHLPGPV